MAAETEDRVTSEPAEENSGVALMLAVAAVVAAALAGRASLRAESAFDAWQQANRTQIKQGAALVEDVRFVFAAEGPSALRAVESRIRADELRAQAAEEQGEVRAAVLAEAEAAEALAAALEESGFELGKEEYRTEDGGLDVTRRLADARNENPELVRLDPDEAQSRGNALGDRAAMGMAATIPVGLAFLFGALGQALPARRRTLVWVGWGAVGVAVLLGILLEVL